MAFINIDKNVCENISHLHKHIQETISHEIEVRKITEKSTVPRKIGICEIQTTILKTKTKKN